MHLGLATKPGYALTECAAIATHGLAEGFITIEDGTEAERQHCSTTETNTDHAGMFENMLFFQFGVTAIILTDDHCKFAAGVTKDGSVIHSLDAFQKEGASGSNSIRKGLLLSDAVRIPRHRRSLRTCWVPEAGTSSTAKVVTTFFEPEERAYNEIG